MTYLSVTQAAARLGVSRQLVWLRVSQGTIKAEKVGSTWVIPEESVAEYERRRADDKTPVVSK